MAYTVVISLLSSRGITLCAFKCQEENCKAFRVTGHNRCQLGSVSKGIYAKKGIVVYSKDELRSPAFWHEVDLLSDEPFDVDSEYSILFCEADSCRACERTRWRRA